MLKTNMQNQTIIYSRDSRQTFFFINKGKKKIRVIIKNAEFKDNLFVIKRVLPEGKKEMDYKDFISKNNA